MKYQFKNAGLINCDFAYVLGVLCSDAHIRPTGSISLKVRDFDFAKRFCETFKVWSGLPMKLRTVDGGKDGGKYYKAEIGSIECSKYLLDFDRNKIKTFSKKLKIYFLSGHLDGDGCVTIPKRKNIRIIHNTVSEQTRELIKDCLISLKIRYNENVIKLKSGKLFYYILISSIFNLKRYSKLIKSSIRRKQKNLNWIINCNIKPLTATKITKEEVMKLNKEGYNDYQIARMYNMSPQTIHQKRKYKLGLASIFKSRSVSRINLISKKFIDVGVKILRKKGSMPLGDLKRHLHKIYPNNQKKSWNIDNAIFKCLYAREQGIEMTYIKSKTIKLMNVSLVSY